jgi:diguanylate cyclase (GGDEF)-like protein/PAS domain S-box-containing protein
MSNRVDMLEATLDLIDEGVAVLDQQSNVLFWNRAAASLTGHRASDLISRRCPDDLYQINEEHRSSAAACAESRQRGIHKSEAAGAMASGYAGQAVLTEIQHESNQAIDGLLLSPTLVSMNHKLGHVFPAMLRRVALLDPCGVYAGAALLFYPVDEVDALPHGETGEGAGIERSQADMEDRLDAAHHQWTTSRMPLGLLWLTVDQAQTMRKTHGHDACEAMLRTVEQTLHRQMNPAETIGRWGNNEFLVVAHERTADLLVEHGRRLAGLARTADFRWWGDRVALTVSIGASQAADGDCLQLLLNRAREAMHRSEYAGGNQVTEARKS